MKKFFSVLICFLCALCTICVLTACNRSTPVSGTGQNSGKKITLHILENDTAKKSGYLDYLLKEFNKKYEADNVEAVDANIDEYANLEDDGPFGRGPDVLYQANDILMKSVNGKHIYPIDITKLDSYNQISQNAWDAYKATVDGKEVYCGVPVNVQQPLLYYRKDLLPNDWKTNWDKNDNDIPDMVEFWNEMYRYSKEIREKDKTKFGFGLQLNNEYFNSGFIFSCGGYVFGKNNTDSTDIGFSKGNAKYGAKIIWDLASIMDKKCVDSSITDARTTMLANGSMFATICTPDITQNFIKDLSAEYEKSGISKEEANKKAKENLIITSLPKLPKSFDITSDVSLTDDSLWMPQKTMGGVNGYGISSWSKHKDWGLKFVEFATSKEMVVKRVEMLGIVPARKDVIESANGDASKITFDNLNSGVLVVMPSIPEVKQIWTPIASGFKKIASDGCDTKTYKLEDLQKILETIDSDIYKAIHTLSDKKSD